VRKEITDKLKLLYRFYENEVTKGNYHNPFDVSSNIQYVFQNYDDLTEDEKFTIEETAYDAGSLFWSM
jgi:hypothetical protein